MPAGASVVGVPGHVVTPRADRAREREEMARRIASRLTQTRDMPDLVTNAIDSMLDHIHTPELIESMQKQLADDEEKVGRIRPSPRSTQSVVAPHRCAKNLNHEQYS
ncbi:MAG: hypothetical protein U1F34_04180 [Gammaproteobacteria bacterium]